MFGYVVINKPELKFREFDEYRGFYCGLCHSLKEQFGGSAQLTLNYDLTFLAILLTALYEPQTQTIQSRCLLHPLKKQQQYQNIYLDYCAKMTVLMSYYHCEDDWEDERKWTRRVEMQLLKEKKEAIEREYPVKCRLIQEEMAAIRQMEQHQEKDPDTMANAFGRIMGSLFEVHEDHWSKTLRETGFYLGKFIYLIDAWEDVEKDVRSGNYNLFKDRFEEVDFDEKMMEILEMMMADCTRSFETLPIFDYREILRNILYSGVWTRAALIRKKKEEKKNEKSV